MNKQRKELHNRQMLSKKKNLYNIVNMAIRKVGKSGMPSIFIYIRYIIRCPVLTSSVQYPSFHVDIHIVSFTIFDSCFEILWSLTFWKLNHKITINLYLTLEFIFIDRTASIQNENSKTITKFLILNGEKDSNHQHQQTKLIFQTLFHSWILYIVCIQVFRSSPKHIFLPIRKYSFIFLNYFNIFHHMYQPDFG